MSQVEISAEAQDVLETVVRGGGFETEAEAVQAALEFYAEGLAAWWAEVEPRVERGRRDIREGRHQELTRENVPHVLAEIQRRGRELLQARRAQ